MYLGIEGYRCVFHGSFTNNLLTDWRPVLQKDEGVTKVD